MNICVQNQLSHRSIRKWKDKEIPNDVLENLFDVINRTASSKGMQHCSVIRVKDRALRKRIREVSTQKYVEEAPELFIFLVDCYRNSRLIEEEGHFFESASDMNRFFQGFTDSALAAQNFTNAAESLGLGCVFFGSILNDTEKMIEILELPRLTFPVLGVGLGYPDQDPTLKPRINKKHKIFMDKYKVFDNYNDLLSEYNEEIKRYYDLRESDRPMESFNKQIIKILSNPSKKRSEILKVIEKQGFNIMEGIK
ncbi:MAG: NADPH-dependent oxidoreductase [Clostridiales bacterium]|nr:MAG: NADPH-dependent oxidoreductase [Clostridiales bacterium]